MKKLFLLILSLNLAVACTEKKQDNKQNYNNGQVVIEQPSQPPVIDSVEQPTTPVTPEPEKPVTPIKPEPKPTPKPVEPKPPVSPVEPDKPPVKPDNPNPVTNFTPSVYTNPQRVALNKQAAKNGDKIMQAAIRNAIALGKDQMKKPIRVITETNYMIGTKDPHQLNSIGAYWHLRNGKWIRIDGKGNGLSEKIGDMAILQQGIGYVIPRLALAYRASDNQAEKDAFAKRMVDYSTAFFLNPKTRMNPNLESANIIPNSKDIRVEKAVEGELFVNIADGLMAIRDSKYYTKEFDAGMKKWYADFFWWLTASPTGKQMEQKVLGNIGFIYESELLACAAFTGNTSYAAKRWPRIQRRLFEEIREDGAMPQEMKRVKSNMYFNKSLQAITETWRILAVQGVPDVWLVEQNGESLEESVLFLLPYMLGQKRFNNNESVKPHYFKKVARTGQYVWRNHPKTVIALERFLAIHDKDFRSGKDPELLTEPYLPLDKVALIKKVQLN